VDPPLPDPDLSTKLCGFQHLTLVATVNDFETGFGLAAR
jgi:hypothetical protein